MSEPLAYLQLTSLEAFVEELKQRGIGEVRLCEWSQRRDIFERRKLRLTAIDLKTGLILRLDIVFYRDFAILHEHEIEKYRQAKEEAEQRITKLEEAGIRLREGEYHYGRAEW